jgi:hypothetical protein
MINRAGIEDVDTPTREAFAPHGFGALSDIIVKVT